MRAEYVVISGSHTRPGPDGEMITYEIGDTILLEEEETTGVLAGRIRKVEDAPAPAPEQPAAVPEVRRHRRGRG